MKTIMTNISPLISIIVPVFNVEKYLKRCVDSIISQTYNNFELLLIDDGSTDNSGKICDDCASKDERIKVIHKKNGGVSSARNLGLDNASGEWITFVDSDDRLDKTALMCFIEESLQDDTFYVGQGLRVENNELKYWPSRYYKGSVVLDSVDDYSLLDGILVYGTPWGKLYNSRIIKKFNIRFDNNLSIHEDHCFYFEYILHVKRIQVIDKVCYYYKVEGSGKSLSSSFKSLDMLLYSYNRLDVLFNDIVTCFRLDIDKLTATKHFLASIKIGCMRAAFHDRKPRKVCYEILKSINTEDIKSYYPLSRSGKLLKCILNIKSICIKYSIFFVVRRILG